MLFFRSKRLFIILIGIIVLVSLIGLSLQDREDLTTAEHFIHDTVGWAQSVIYTPVKFVTNIFSDVGNLKDTFNENKDLKEKISQYKDLNHDVKDLKADNEELRKMLDKTESIRDFNPIQATVVARSPERWIEQITINKGSESGITPNMAVITADGMIGKVQTASPYTSTVQLLTGFDQFNRISATIAKEEGKDIIGLIEEFDKEANALLFKIIEESDTNIQKGDTVVSSGMGGVFPAGLSIGTVIDVVPDQYGLTSTALVKPAANMYAINHVIVVDRTLDDGTEVSDEEGDKK